MTIKSFGKGKKAPEAVPFELAYMDADGEEQVATFNIRPRADAGAVASMLEAQAHHPEEIIGKIIRFLATNMDDKDELVRASWQPTALPDTGQEPSYRGPDGEIYAFNDDETLASWEDQSCWTSRRRWNHLMIENENASVDAADLNEVVEWVIGLATARPTRPRA